MNAVNLSGGNADVDDNNADDVFVPPLTPAPTKKKSKKTPSYTAKKPDADANTRAHITYFQHRATESDKMPCDTDLLLRLSSELEEAASPTFHLTKMKTTVAYSKCNCLHSLLYKDSGQLRADVAMVVANYALHHMQSPKAAQDQTFIDLLRMSQKFSPKKKNSTLFTVPFNIYKGNTQEALVHLSSEDLHLLNNHTICVSALMIIFQRNYDYYQGQKKIALNCGGAKPNGNIGRKRSVASDEIAYPMLKDFFERLSKLCEVRATETVRNMCGITNSTADIDRVYLPTWMSLRGCYASYLDDLGYDVKQYNDGNYEVLP